MTHLNTEYWINEANKHFKRASSLAEELRKEYVRTKNYRILALLGWTGFLVALLWS